MSKLSKLQKAKRSFRASKAWKEFRHKMNVKQKGIDPITDKKLCKGCNLHHRHITANEEEYTNISKDEDFVMLNKQTHEFLHWLYKYWKDDPAIIERIVDEFGKWY